ncbi:MAG: GNAT family protein [Balneolaceae bacterium]|nr:GNAT family protein [Balneolaceae bacterium]
MVEIKPFDLQNVRLHYKWNNDAELNYYDSDYPHEHEAFDDFLRRIKAVANEKNEAAELFEIHLEESGKLIGIVDIHAIDHYNRRCFVNCTIGDRDYAGKGLDLEALEVILRYCFNRKELNKVATTAFDFNTSWIEHVESLGFRREGTLRQHVLKKGEFRDKLIYSLLRQEFTETESSNGTNGRSDNILSHKV